MAQLVVSEGGRRQTFPLGGAKVVVGRDVGCEIVISDPHSSRRHCEIVPTGDGYELVDRNSSNGTVHNGARIERVPLVAGDRIQIGEVLIEFIAPPAGGEDRSARPAISEAETPPAPVATWCWNPRTPGPGSPPTRS